MPRQNSYTTGFYVQPARPRFFYTSRIKSTLKVNLKKKKKKRVASDSVFYNIVAIRSSFSIVLVSRPLKLILQKISR